MKECKTKILECVDMYAIQRQVAVRKGRIFHTVPPKITQLQKLLSGSHFAARIPLCSILWPIIGFILDPFGQM